MQLNNKRKLESVNPQLKIAHKLDIIIPKANLDDKLLLSLFVIILINNFRKVTVI